MLGIFPKTENLSSHWVQGVCALYISLEMWNKSLKSKHTFLFPRSLLACWLYNSKVKSSDFHLTMKFKSSLVQFLKHKSHKPDHIQPESLCRSSLYLWILSLNESLTEISASVPSKFKHSVFVQMTMLQSVDMLQNTTKHHLRNLLWHSSNKTLRTDLV